MGTAPACTLGNARRWNAKWLPAAKASELDICSFCLFWLSLWSLLAARWAFVKTTAQRYHCNWESERKSGPMGSAFLSEMFRGAKVRGCSKKTRADPFSMGAFLVFVLFWSKCKQVILHGTPIIRKHSLIGSFQNKVYCLSGWKLDPGSNWIQRTEESVRDVICRNIGIKVLGM